MRGMKDMAMALGTALVVQASGAEPGPRAGTAAPAPATVVPAVWEYTAPLLTPEKRDTDVSVAQKDPSVVFHDGCAQTMVVDPGRLRFVFQGMLEQEKTGRTYGRFPWRIGILAPAGASLP